MSSKEQQEANMLFLNITNHPSSKWGEKQMREAIGFNTILSLGGRNKILDVPFPNISPSSTSDEVEDLARKMQDEVEMRILGSERKKPFYFVLQGEFSLCYTLFPLLGTIGGIPVVPTTERKSVEETLPDKTTKKTQIFEFVQWRMVPQT